MSEHPIKRCAVYTRKSSDEGLEQDYNSLHAQRDACEAYIKSQGGEGWRLSKAPYDDGGFSGGTMERPALEQLLAAIRQGLVDVVVVYKVDRLTRSLADFARMVELFDAHRVSFVAVTQQFNTTTSMGRLTLNVLLSFAQFEREVIGERIRDKVAASKRKGIWTGGCIPFGYEVRERKLLINSEEAPIVRQIFERYLELGTVRKLMKDLSFRGIGSAIRISKTGNRQGGKSFGRGALYHLLSNPVYVGEIRHKDERHPGQHEALIRRELWERVQTQLRSKPGRKSGVCETAAPLSPLTARLFDENGEPLYVQGCAKGRRRYRYYVSKALVRGDNDSTENGWRLSAPEIEHTVAAITMALFGDQPAIVTAAEQTHIDQGRLSSVLKYVRALLERLQSADQSDSALREVVERVQLNATTIRLVLAIRLLEEGSSANTISLTKDFPMQIRRRGVEMRMVLPGENGAVRFDRSLLRAVGRAHRWRRQIETGQLPSIGGIARNERIAARYIRDLMPLAFLSPKIVKAIAEGRQPPDLSIISLARRIELPLLWTEQPQILGIADSARWEPADFSENPSGGTS
jgi:DNA invertase Pin-like site-specific DNA recombinase